MNNQNKPNDDVFPLHAAAKRGDVEAVARLLKEGVDVNTFNVKHSTPLHYAAESGNVEIIRMLMAAGADVNAKNRWNMGPLYAAIFGRNEEIIDILLEAGADVDAENHLAETPLTYGAELGIKCIDKLLGRSKAKGVYGAKCLRVAANNDHYDSCVKLLDCGVDVDSKDELGHTVLHDIVSERELLPERAKIIKLLIERGADVNYRSERGLAFEMSPLDEVIHNGWEEIVDLMLNNGGKLSLNNLTTAAQLGHAHLINRLLDSAENVSLEQLMFATIDAEDYRNERMEVFDILLERGGNPLATNELGESMLHIAAQRANLEMCKKLIKLGVQTNAKNNDGATPFDYAQDQRSWESDPYYGGPYHRWNHVLLVLSFD